MLNYKTPSHALTTQDIMQRVRLSIPQHMSLQGAARLMSRAKVGAAPVTDAHGHCIGLLSADAFLRLATDRRAVAMERNRSPVWCEWQIVEVQPQKQTEVGQQMLIGTPLISSSVTVFELIRLMLRGRFRVAIVVDGEGRPTGIVSGTDVLGALTGDISNPASQTDEFVSENNRKPGRRDATELAAK